MSRLLPVPRRILIRKLKRAGFNGPFIATRHEYMIKGKEKIFVPNPHGKDIGIPILKRIINQLKISQKEFLNL